MQTKVIKVADIGDSDEVWNLLKESYNLEEVYTSGTVKFAKSQEKEEWKTLLLDVAQGVLCADFLDGGTIISLLKYKGEVEGRVLTLEELKAISNGKWIIARPNGGDSYTVLKDGTYYGAKSALGHYNGQLFGDIVVSNDSVFNALGHAWHALADGGITADLNPVHPFSHLIEHMKMPLASEEQLSRLILEIVNYLYGGSKGLIPYTLDEDYPQVDEKYKEIYRLLNLKEHVDGILFSIHAAESRNKVTEITEEENKLITESRELEITADQMEKWRKDIRNWIIEEVSKVKIIETPSYLPADYKMKELEL